MIKSKTLTIKLAQIENKILNDNKKLRRKFLAAYCLSKYNLKQIVFLFSPIHFQQIH